MNPKIGKFSLKILKIPSKIYTNNRKNTNSKKNKNINYCKKNTINIKKKWYYILK